MARLPWSVLEYLLKIEYTLPIKHLKKSPESEMKPIETTNYLIRLLDPKDPDELREVQRLRYDFLLREFDEKKAESGGLDDDGYDAYTDSILAIDKRTGRIVGTYRLATAETLKGHPYKTEEEFDISALKNDPDGIVEAGRAVVHGDHRNGTVIGLLWRGLITYTMDHHLRYIFGTCSLHGTDPDKYTDCTSVLNQYYLSERFDVRAVRDSFAYGGRTDLTRSNTQIPGLLKAYLMMGAQVSRNGFIDYDFNCCDVMTILDCSNLNERFMKRFLGG